MVVKILIKYLRPLGTYFFILGLAIIFFHIDHGVELKNATKKLLTVYAYSSFTQSWGAGPELVLIFEEACNCKVDLIDAGDSGVLLQKLRYEVGNVDVVLGMDQMTKDEALSGFAWHEFSEKFFSDIQWSPMLPVSLEKKTLIPFDWAPLTFVIRKGDVKPPISLDDLLDQRFEKKISLQDPRTSNLGFQFYYWLISEKGEAGAINYLEKLKGNIFSMAPSWSAAYGLFQTKQVPLTFSYLTSLMYHWQQEKDLDQIEAANFVQGHPYQVEYVGIPATSADRDLAEKFIRFLLSEKAQEIIVTRNFMLPVVKLTSSSENLRRLPKLKIKELNYSSLTAEKKKTWLELWKGLW